MPSLKIQNDSPNQIFAFYILVHGRIGHGSFQKEIVCSMGAAMQWKFARESILPLLNHSKPRFSHGFPGKSLAFYSCRGEVSSSGLHRWSRMQSSRNAAVNHWVPVSQADTEPGLDARRGLLSWGLVTRNLSLVGCKDGQICSERWQCKLTSKNTASQSKMWKFIWMISGSFQMKSRSIDG